VRPAFSRSRSDAPREAFVLTHVHLARRKEFDLGVKLRARLLTTVPDSTSLKFILLGTLTRRSDKKGSKGERHIVVHIDFASLNKRKCGDKDLEKWYARTIGGQPDCLMGHKVRSSPSSSLSSSRSLPQRLSPRPADAPSRRAAILHAPQAGRRLRRRREVEGPGRPHGELRVRRRGLRVVRLLPLPLRQRSEHAQGLTLPLVLARSDYNFAPDESGNCVPVGPETIPAGQCLRDGDKFKGSSGYRLIPGNTCDVKRGIKKDAPKEKPCSAGKETPGLVSHQSVRPSLPLSPQGDWLEREKEHPADAAVALPARSSRSPAT